MSETEKKQISEQEETKNEQIREMGQILKAPEYYADLPDTYVCPICFAEKDQFEEM